MSLKKLSVARLGRSVGLKGEMKLHSLTDFPEQFKKGATFQSDRGELTIESYNPERGSVKFEGINTPEEAKRYTNAYLYSDEESSRENIELKDNEYFWFDILGCDVYEGDTRLGRVKEIHRLPSCDYIEIATDKALVEKEKAKSFLLPFLDRFIQSVDTEAKQIDVKGAMDILESS